MDEKYQKIIKEDIAPLVEQGRLSLYLGAGYSVGTKVASGTTVPSTGQLIERHPYGDTATWEPVLIQIMSHFVTELWDQTFSQSEIDVALKIAIGRLGKYAAGEDRRGDRSR
jgi:hypothetical protein